MAASKSNILLQKQLLTLSKPVLNKKCKKHNLPTYGTKKQMVDRIISAQNQPQKIRKKKKTKTNITKKSSKKRKTNQLLQQSVTKSISFVASPTNISSQNNFIPPPISSPSKKKHSHQKHNKNNKKKQKPQTPKPSKNHSKSINIKTKLNPHKKPQSLNPKHNGKPNLGNHKKRKRKVSRKVPKINKRKVAAAGTVVPAKINKVNVNTNKNTRNIPTLQRWYKKPPVSNNNNNKNVSNFVSNKHQFPLYIVRDDIGTTQLFTDCNYTITQLKQQISVEILQLPLNGFRISIQNLKPLNKEHLTLSDYNIQRGTRIHVHIYTHSQVQQLENSFHLTIKITNNENNQYAYYHMDTDLFKIFSVNSTTAVVDLKNRIKDKTNISVAKQILTTTNGVILNNKMKLNRYEIKHQHVIYLEIKSIENDYFNKLLNEGIVSMIDPKANGVLFEIWNINNKFTQAMSAMNGEMIAMLQIEKNKKQNMLIYESLLSTMKNKTDDLLFHGTTFDNVEKIIINGFNRDYNINAKYGKGSYFAKSARYAALYSNKDEETGHYALLVCRCIIGKYGLGKEDMDTSELYNKNNPGLQYDSLVNDLNDPQIYVINRDYHAVPVYIILFELKASANNQ